MKKVEILIIGRNPEILKTVVRLVNQNAQWNGQGVLTDEEALTIVQTQPFNLILLTNGIEEASEIKLRQAFASQQPNAIIIQHYGGGSGLLSGEIQQALERI
jgi:DNA-binding NtrC family response regulator